MYTSLMRLSLLLIFPIVILSACTTQSPDTGDASQSHASSSMRAASSSSTADEQPTEPPPLDQTSHSGSYTNAAYGFSLMYPTHFEPLQKPYWRVYRYHNSRVENNILKNDEADALFALSARDRELPGDLKTTVAVYPLKGYSYVNIYDDEYLYNADTGTWSRVMAQNSFEPKSRSYNGITMYEFTFGDAGYFERTFAILQPEKNIVVEISIGGCLGCIPGSDGFEGLPQEQYDSMQKHADTDTETILRSFRWMD